MHFIRSVFRGIAAAVFLSGAPGYAATTLTFGAVPADDGGQCTPFDVIDRGYTISNCPRYFGTPGTVHLDDSGTSFRDAVTISNATLFDALTVDVQGLDWQFLTDVTPSGGVLPVGYDNVLIGGYRGGTLIASLGVSTLPLVAGQAWATIVLGPAFRNLDTLRITQVLPGAADLAGTPGAQCFDAPCAHLNIDNVTLQVAAVPLPAAGVLFAGALAGLVAVRRVSRRPGSR